ncbi:unnamed protein product [Phytomonas sp. Hart1]|nr:unnamed protein product [Phytomonas sp. Hart1]|eukprot:CCW67388.1 unnamed protein product [Phytomonas sp. isolate Hart1]
MSALTKLIPNTENLLKQAATMPLSSISSKYILLYFSASWCPPCRGFTPILADFYNKLHKEKNFEVVFVSWDEEEEDHTKYYEKMPWLAIPFEQSDTVKLLANRYSVESIPTLIAIEAETGNVITTSGVSKVREDPEGKNFPWTNKK